MEHTMKVHLIEELTGICGDMGNKKMPPTYTFNAANNMKNIASGNESTILQLLTNLQNKFEQLTNNNSSNQIQGGGTSDNQDLPLLNPNTRKVHRRYCWSHDCCNHQGQTYKKKIRTQK